MERIEPKEVMKELQEGAKRNEVTMDLVFDIQKVNRDFCDNISATKYLKAKNIFRDVIEVNEGKCFFIEGNTAYLRRRGQNYYYVSKNEFYQSYLELDCLDLVEIICQEKNYSNRVEKLLSYFDVDTEEKDFIERQRQMLRRNVCVLEGLEFLDDVVKKAIIYINNFSIDMASIGYEQMDDDGCQFYFLSAGDLGKALEIDRNLANKILIFLFWLGFIERVESLRSPKNNFQITTFKIPEYTTKVITKASILKRNLDNRGITFRNLNRKKLESLNKEKAKRVYAK